MEATAKPLRGSKTSSTSTEQEKKERTLVASKETINRAFSEWYEGVDWAAMKCVVGVAIQCQESHIWTALKDNGRDSMRYW